MRIVVLDGYTINPGDLSWAGLEALGETVVYDRTPQSLVVERAQDAEIVLTNKTPLRRAVIERLPALRCIGVLATGYDVVDGAAAQERQIVVTNIPTYGTASVAQMVFAHLLNWTQHVAHHAETVREGRWTAGPDWCYWDYPLVEMAGLTMGLLGLGRIGQQVAQIGLAFGMEIIAHDPYLPASPLPAVRLVDMDAVFRESDVLSLHLPLTPATRGLVNAARLAQMKRTAFLINTSRGPLIDEPALAQALNAGEIAGAALDVLSAEPPPADNPLLTARNCAVTPHISWATRAARVRLMQMAVDNVATFLAGRPQNVVNRG